MAGDGKNNGATATVAYPPFTTFKSFVGDLAEKGMPARIDNTVMVGKSGSMKSTLKGALEFLGLITENGTPTERLKQLRDSHSDPEKWKATLGEVVTEAYSPIIGDLSLKTGTAQQLADRFRQSASISGSTLTRAVRFYLAALDEAQIPRSKYFVPPKRPRSPGSKKKGENQDGNGGAPTTKPPEPPTEIQSEISAPEGWRVHPFNLPTRMEPIQVIAPADLSEKEWRMVNTFMEAYIALVEGN